MKTFKSLAVFVLALSLTTSVFAGSQKIDAAKSSVKWLGKKIGGEHGGTIGVKEGKLVVENGKITGGKVVIDMTSIVDTDLTDAGYNAKLIGHLKSDDFFSVATFPTSELVITKDENSGNTHVLSGNLTIKGITNPASFTATSEKDGTNTIYKGTLTIDRSKYNVRYGSKSFFDNLGDKVIMDEFTLDFTLVVAE
ncbi:MAG TPA: YceI family protein [Prolixibacteraceae bacterium]|nr:YceI family protein [Prolixibacteraceae bacterium]